MAEATICPLLVSRKEKTGMRKRQNHDAGFKSSVTLKAVKSARSRSLAVEYGVHPTTIRRWKEALL